MASSLGEGFDPPSRSRLPGRRTDPVAESLVEVERQPDETIRDRFSFMEEGSEFPFIKFKSGTNREESWNRCGKM